MAHIAFLGTGLLGGAFAEAAARRGDTVTAWNRTHDKVLALGPAGVKAAASPADAVRGAARVHVVLRDDDVVEEVLAQARGALDAAAVIVDHSTTLPARTAARAARYAAEGVAYLHCPVFMGPPAALKAQGIMLACGPRPLFDRVQADLARMTGRLEYLGERADLAAVHKLLGNATLIGMWGVLADVLTLAKASGIGLDDALQGLARLDLNAALARRGAAMAAGDFTPNFELTMARKDVGLMQALADGLPLAALPAVGARMDALISVGHGAKDAAVLAIDALGGR
jgi:3-hydroxyisobutyrate dehydrogenase